MGAGVVIYFHDIVESSGGLIAAFTAGAFIYIAATDLIPELHKTSNPARRAIELISFLIGIILMFLLTFLEV